MDAYYGRRPHPHKRDGKGVCMELTDPKEIAEYHRGFDDEHDRKDWGDGRGYYG